MRNVVKHMRHFIHRTVAKALVVTRWPVSEGCRSIYQHSEYGKFKTSQLNQTPQFVERFEFYRFLHTKYIANIPIDYLEFGVYKGESMQRWLTLNTNPESRFFGFDSFEGLPERWDGLAAGFFSTAGAAPSIQDSRVQFIKGWFQNTLRPFLEDFRPRHKLVIHCDADLYSSTLFILASLDGIITRDTLIIFDELSSPSHEYRAYVDYTHAFQRHLTPVAVANNGHENEQVAFIVT